MFLVSIGIGLLLAVPLAYGQVYGNKGFKAVIAVFERILRSIPLLVILFLIYYGSPQILNIRFTPFQAAVLGIGLRSAAYQSQIYRGAILSISGTQLKAALSLGMSSFQAFFHVILPQAVRIAIPPFANEAAIVLKDTSLAYALGVVELMRQGYYVMTNTAEPLAVFITIAAIYFIMTASVNILLATAESKLKIPGIGVEGRSR